MESPNLAELAKIIQKLKEHKEEDIMPEILDKTLQQKLMALTEATILLSHYEGAHDSDAYLTLTTKWLDLKDDILILEETYEHLNMYNKFKLNS